MDRGWDFILACCLPAILTGGCSAAKVEAPKPQDGTSLAMVQYKSDEALHEAKGQGRNNYQFYK